MKKLGLGFKVVVAHDGRMSELRRTDPILLLVAVVWGSSYLSAQTAADILYALASPQTHQLLRRHCDWSIEQYRTWLANAVTQQLLGE